MAQQAASQQKHNLEGQEGSLLKAGGCQAQVERNETGVETKGQFQYEQEGIADRMLRQLEDQYWEVQKYNIPIKEQTQQEHHAEDDNEIPQGYTTFEQAQDNNLNSGSESDKQSEPEPSSHQQTQELAVDIHGLEHSLQSNPETIELVEVGPAPESMFQVPEDNEAANNLDFDKIRCFALSLDVKTPQWAKNPEEVEKRVKELFKNQSKIGEFKKIDGF